MEASQISILISIAVLLIVVALVFLIKKNKKEKRFTPLAGIAFAFIIFGILFGDNRLVGYSLMAAGVLFAVLDMLQKFKKK